MQDQTKNENYLVESREEKIIETKTVSRFHRLHCSNLLKQEVKPAKKEKMIHFSKFSCYESDKSEMVEYFIFFPPHVNEKLIVLASKIRPVPATSHWASEL